MTKKVYLKFADVWQAPLTGEPYDCMYCTETDTVEIPGYVPEDLECDNPDTFRKERINKTKGKHWKTQLRQLPTYTETDLKKLSDIVKEYDGSIHHNIFISSITNVFSLADCVTGARNGQLEDKVLAGEKIHKNSHLKHYQAETLLQMIRRMRYEEFNCPFPSFEELYNKVEYTAGCNPDNVGYPPIEGFGLVGLYDTALRIGYHISRSGKHDNPERVLPQKYVYVHQGSREGFMHLVRRGLVEKTYLPERPGFIKVDTRCFIGALKGMEAYKIENLLCCMKKQLGNI